MRRELPFDLFRCVPSRECRDRERCARYTSAHRPDGWQATMDASVMRLEQSCSLFEPNTTEEDGDE